VKSGAIKFEREIQREYGTKSGMTMGLGSYGSARGRNMSSKNSGPFSRFAVFLGYVIPGGCPVVYIAAGPYGARYSSVGASRCRWSRAARAHTPGLPQGPAITMCQRRLWATRCKLDGQQGTHKRACVKESRFIAACLFPKSLA
jgi:hypothetical protein